MGSRAVRLGNFTAAQGLARRVKGAAVDPLVVAAEDAGAVPIEAPEAHGAVRPAGGDQRHLGVECGAPDGPVVPAELAQRARLERAGGGAVLGRFVCAEDGCRGGVRAWQVDSSQLFEFDACRSFDACYLRVRRKILQDIGCLSVRDTGPLVARKPCDHGWIGMKWAWSNCTDCSLGLISCVACSWTKSSGLYIKKTCYSGFIRPALDIFVTFVT